MRRVAELPVLQMSYETAVVKHETGSVATCSCTALRKADCIVHGTLQKRTEPH